MEGNILHWKDIPTVTSMDAFEAAVEAFKRGGSRSEFMTRLFALGLPTELIRFLADCPGRTIVVRER
jgi:hypothetical protein